MKPIPYITLIDAISLTRIPKSTFLPFRHPLHPDQTQSLTPRRPAIVNRPSQNLGPNPSTFVGSFHVLETGALHQSEKQTAVRNRPASPFFHGPIASSSSSSALSNKERVKSGYLIPHVLKLPRKRSLESL